MASINILDLSKYEVLNKLGKGSFATVRKVMNKDTNDIYAAKIINNEIDDSSQEEIEVLSHEVNIISRLNHPSVIRFYGFSPINFKKQNRPVILTEFASNGTLKQVIQLEREFMSLSGWDDTKKLIIIFGIASGMSYLHSHNIIHRDLKPENILMDDFLFPKISDFGLSKINHSKSSMTFQSKPDIKGTPIYIAPEIWESQKYDKAGDVYSFSLIVYEIITNEKPFNDLNSISEIFVKVVMKGIRPEFNFSVPVSYRHLIEKCWSYDPTDRPTFDDIVSSLKNDSGFITNCVDAGNYLNYIDFIEQYHSSFNKIQNKINLNEIAKSRNLYSIKNEDENHPSKVMEIENSEDDPKNDFIIGKNYFEGINGFTKDLNLGIKYLKKSANAGCIDSAIFYCRLLIEGKFVQKDIVESKIILEKFLDSKNPIIYTLYGKILNEQKDYAKAEIYFQKSLIEGNAEAQYEYGKMLIKKGVKYLKMSQKNGFSESGIFLSKYFQNLDDFIDEENCDVKNNGDQSNMAKHFNGWIMDSTDQYLDSYDVEAIPRELRKTYAGQQKQRHHETKNDQRRKNRFYEFEEEEFFDDLIKTIDDSKDAKNSNHEKQNGNSINDNVILTMSYITELKRLLQIHQSKFNRKRAVLITTGSYCPIHKGHLNILDVASKFLSNEYQIDSILGIISPSKDNFVSMKFGHEKISYEHRYKMTELACNEHNLQIGNEGLFIVPNDWEGTQETEIDFIQVYFHFKEEIGKLFNDSNLIVLCVCGGELFMDSGCSTFGGFVGIASPGFHINESSKPNKHIYVCNDKKYNGFYSNATLAIKMAKEKGEPIVGLTYDSVEKYLHDVVHWI